MKKFFAILLVLTMALSMAACGGTGDNNTTTAPNNDGTTAAPAEDTTAAPADDTTAPADDVNVMTHADYIAAAVDDPVVIETYVQATQSWYNDTITVYAQSEDGAYFLYNMACSEEDAAKLVPGTKIRVTGYKSEWSGEVEIVDATFEILEGSYIAEATDVTDLLGTDELIDHQNEFVSFTGLTVAAVEYKNGEPGDDIYVTLTYGDQSYSFCVELYLTGPDTDVYKAVGELEAGDIVNMEGFLYWYEGVNTHITSVTVVG